MAAQRSRRKPPLEDEILHAVNALDKTAELEVQYINSYKGREVFAKAHFGKGDFVVEYRGELIHFQEVKRRRRTYHGACAVFMFDFYWKENTWKFFSKNGKPTIVPIPNPNVTIGKATQMSPNDILRVNRLYSCSMYLLTYEACYYYSL
ncbi:N-lysine methyltransferase KMT5A-like [Scomber scombrus]|uniref:N-lysine methyltransferase KMT5A-like n=1 Tax=Scomber scombrus TaxID=13677 RepID=A0AAV1PFP5_SCOSC